MEVKEKLFLALDTFLTPIREKRSELEGKNDVLDKILIEGTSEARKVAQETMIKVKKAMKIDYFG